MKKVLALILIAIFLSSVPGCTPKSEYEKLLDQKTTIEKKCADLVADQIKLNQTIATRDMEIKDLKNELKTANAKVKELESELAKANAKIAALEPKTQQ